MNIRYLILVATLVILPAPPGRSVIVDLGVSDGFHRPIQADFDVESQILTLTDERRTVPDDPYAVDSELVRRIDGYTTWPYQTETLHIIWNISNESPVAWTGFVVMFGGDVNTWAYVIDNSPHSDAFPEANISLEGRVLEFSGTSVVLPGETLVIQFDARIDGLGGTFGTVLHGAPAPEPTSLLVLGCGAVMLLRSRRCVQ